MKKLLPVLLLLALSVWGCNKNKETCDDEINVTAPASEVTALRSYLTSQSITATEDPRGFFYTITTAGTGIKPNRCSTVNVDYEGKLTNGTTFDSGTNVTFPLSALILGWQEAIPLIAKAGTIVIYLPPTLAYGANGSGPIPANANLIFTITLNDVR